MHYWYLGFYLTSRYVAYYQECKVQEFCIPVTTEIMKELLRRAWMDNWVSDSWPFLIFHLTVRMPRHRGLFHHLSAFHSIVVDYALLVSDIKEAGRIVIFF